MLTHRLHHVNTAVLEVSQIGFLRDYASWQVYQENFYGEVSRIAKTNLELCEQDYEAKTILDLIMRRVQNQYIRDAIMHPKEKIV